MPTAIFLAELDARPWTSESSSIRASGYFLGRGQSPLEVALADADRRPTGGEIRGVWKRRHGGKASPLLLVVRYTSDGSSRVAVCGPVGEEPIVASDLDADQVERLARAALQEPDRNAAIRFVAGAFTEIDSELPGIRNEGMLAMHQLATGVPSRPDWLAACQEGVQALRQGGEPLVEALGFKIEARGSATWVLRAAGTASAIAVFLNENENPDTVTPRFGGTTPVSYALATADAEGLPYVVLTRGRHIRLFGARKNMGVGRKGRAETFIEANLALLPTDRAGYLPLLFGAGALTPGGTFEQILESSRDYAADLGDRLRERVYNQVVPALAKAVSGRWRKGSMPTDADLSWLYRETLFILFRLLFVAYAEDKELMPYRANDRYRARSLKILARELSDAQNQGSLLYDPASTDLWERVSALWTAVDSGNRGWGVPAYNGGLFSSDSKVSDVGAALALLTLNDLEFGPPLFNLLVDQTHESNFGPVDFRSLSVREFGTIYEGLLESELSLAPSDLSIDEDGNYIPATSIDRALVMKDEVYLHNRSGARKSSGSYFTKSQVVEHLVEFAVEPALSAHLQHLSELVDSDDQPAAAEAFFDFRCVDLAMGSGHFLVAAVDHIESRLSSFLAGHPIPQVSSELERLRVTALQALGPLENTVEIETSSLLRRQVARRFVYGVDINDIAVELARLSLWIHTFVPGLPLGFLNHNLVVGNSLTGIATLDEALSVLDPGEVGAQPTFIRRALLEALDQARRALARLARVSDANAREIAEARKSLSQAQNAAEPARRLFDMAVAVRLGATPPAIYGPEDLESKGFASATASAASLAALHFPVTFAEVFLRSSAGFDVVIGNPPWDNVLFEPEQFWVTRAPGLKRLTPEGRDAEIARLRKQRPTDAAAEVREQRERERLQELVKAAYSKQGSGHYDFAKLFVERASNLLAKTGWLGYVLPGNSLLLGGWAELRHLAFDGTDTSVVEARNKAGWLFDEVEHRYAVALLARGRVQEGYEGSSRIWPGVTSLKTLETLTAIKPLSLSNSELAELTQTWVLPWFNSRDDPRVFEKMRGRPTLASGSGWIRGWHDARWDFRGSGPHRELASSKPDGKSWKVLMTRHVDAYHIDDTSEFRRFINDPGRLIEAGSGIARSGKQFEIGADHPVLVFRHPSRNDDARTLIATGLPQSGFIHNKGYVHGIQHKEGTDHRRLLAFLSYLNSYTCDWWVRRFVDRHVTAPVINGIRLPNWVGADIERAAALSNERLFRGGSDVLAGGIQIRPSEEFKDWSFERLVVASEQLAIKGFGLNQDELGVILSDFSDRGCPPALRAALLE